MMCLVEDCLLPSSSNFEACDIGGNKQRGFNSPFFMLNSSLRGPGLAFCVESELGLTPMELRGSEFMPRSINERPHPVGASVPIEISTTDDSHALARKRLECMDVIGDLHVGQ